jgi:hypothetical protein
MCLARAHDRAVPALPRCPQDASQDVHPWVSAPGWIGQTPPDFMPGWKCGLCEDVAGDPAEGCVPGQADPPPATPYAEACDAETCDAKDDRSPHRNDLGATVIRAGGSRAPPARPCRRIAASASRMSRSPLYTDRVLGAPPSGTARHERKAVFST